MIDYKTFLLELEKHVNEQIELNHANVTSNNYDNGEFWVYIDIRSRIIQFKEKLTKEVPAYKIGDEVWILCNNLPENCTVEEHSFHAGSYWLYRCSTFGTYEEEYLYPSKEALIDAQIEHWESMKEKGRIRA